MSKLEEPKFNYTFNNHNWC